MCSKAKEFALALAILECAIKPVAMLPVWKDSLGHTRYLLTQTILSTPSETFHSWICPGYFLEMCPNSQIREADGFYAKICKN